MQSPTFRVMFAQFLLLVPSSFVKVFQDGFTPHFYLAVSIMSTKMMGPPHMWRMEHAPNLLANDMTQQSLIDNFTLSYLI
jgi:hypothetical protein